MENINGVMMQYFHWYNTEEDNIWQKLINEAENLQKAGITSIWMPPPYKGSAGTYDVGYGVYDLFDLGEFDQKGTIRTKYGTKQELIDAVKALQNLGIQVLIDVVFNHKLGGDNVEEFNARAINPHNREETVSDMMPCKSYTNFKFEGRNKKYSEFEWHWHHFSACDYNELDEDETPKIYLFEGKEFNEQVDLEKGNYDYLMGNNIDMNHPDVINELNYWGEWIINTLGIDGFRIDAVKHIKFDFFKKWLDHLRGKFRRELFAVGEYWSANLDALMNFIQQTKGKMKIFDVGLHFNFAVASKMSNDYDLRTIFDNSLIKYEPTMAVTIVQNHDSQPLQALELVVEDWFKPIAYSLILLRREGYPCIFYADYYGAHYKDVDSNNDEQEIWISNHNFLIDKYLYARQKYSYGDQYDYFDHSNCIGWTRTGDEENPGGMAVLISNGDEGNKSMQTSVPNKEYYDVTEHLPDTITTDENGWAEFRCPAGSVSVWIPKE